MMHNLRDSFGRRFSYLRLSVIEACNFRCTYCLPNGYKKKPNEAAFLSLSEIQNLVSCFAELGTTKLRLTGGEPTLRPDFLEIAKIVRDTPGIEKIALSTNAFKLKSLLPELQRAGIQYLNISLDSLDPAVFLKMTGSSQLNEITCAIEEAFSYNFAAIKINVVLMKDLNDKSYVSFLNWAKTAPLTIRFIELMPTLQNNLLFKAHHINSQFLKEDLKSRGWKLKPREMNAGPAEEYAHPDYRGQMGFIAPYEKDFCGNCNRLRVTSQGALRLCLFGEGNYSLRDLLQSPDQKEELQLRLFSLLQKKEISHYLSEEKYGNNFSFSSMGG